MDTYLKSTVTNDEIKNVTFLHNMKILREIIYEYMLKISKLETMNDTYLNFEEIFQKDIISHVDIPNNTYINKLVDDLENHGWKVKKLFNNTALLICKSQEDIENSMWNSTF